MAGAKEQGRTRGDGEYLGTQPDVFAARSSRQHCLLHILVFLAVDILRRNAKNHGAVLYLAKGLCARGRHQQGSMMLEQHPPQGRRKNGLWGRNEQKEREREGWRAEGQQIRQALLLLAGGELERTKEGRRKGEGWLLQSCPHCTARNCFCPPDSNIWLYTHLYEIIADYCRPPRSKQPEANP